MARRPAVISIFAWIDKMKIRLSNSEIVWLNFLAHYKRDGCKRQLRKIAFERGF